MSGLNGLESWNLNIQSGYAICMKAAGIMYGSSAARCEAYAALSWRRMSGEGLVMLDALGPKSSVSGISFNQCLIHKDGINICQDPGGLKLKSGEVESRLYFESFAELDEC